MVWFSSVAVWAWNSSGGSGFWFGRFLWERVPPPPAGSTVPVPVSVPETHGFSGSRSVFGTVLAVPISSGSGSVSGHSCFWVIVLMQYWTEVVWLSYQICIIYPDFRRRPQTQENTALQFCLIRSSCFTRCLKGGHLQIGFRLWMLTQKVNCGARSRHVQVQGNDVRQKAMSRQHRTLEDTVLILVCRAWKCSGFRPSHIFGISLPSVAVSLWEGRCGVTRRD